MSYRRTHIFLVLLLSFTIYNYVVCGLAENAGEFSWPMFRGNLRRTGYSTATPKIDKLWWKFSGHVQCSPAVVDDKVFIGLENGVYALNAKTGTKIWNYTVEVGLYALSVADGMVFIGSTDHNIYALNETTGDQIWNYTTGWRVNSCPTVMEDIVFIGSDDGNVYALNETTGKMVWKYTTGNSVWSSPAVADGMVFIGSGDYNVYALNETNGIKIWNYTTGFHVDSSPVVANGMVFIGSHDHNLYVLDEVTGKEIWKYHTDAEVFHSPAVVGDRVYFPSNNCLYVFGPKPLIEILFPIIFLALAIGAAVLIVMLHFVRARKADEHDIKK